MTDILGPSGASFAVTTRPTDGRVFGPLDTWFTDCTSATADDGTDIDAEFLNAVVANLRALARGNGQTLGGQAIVGENNADGMLLASVQNLIQRGLMTRALDTGGANAIVVTLSPVPAEMIDGFTVWAKVKVANTGPTTITVNGVVYNVVTEAGAPLGGGELPASAWKGFRFEAVSSKFQVASSGQSATIHSGDDTSTTANQIVVPNLSPPITAYAKYQRHQIKLANAITGPNATVTLSGLPTARTLVRADETPTQGGDGAAGQILDVIDDGVNLQIVGLQTSLTQGRLVKTTIWNAAGAYSFVPQPATRWFRVTVDGSGAAGTGSGSSSGYFVAGGGGGGGRAISELLVSALGGAPVPCTVGAGGKGTTNGNTGAAANGNTTSFGSFCSATGGTGATYAASQAAGNAALWAGGGGGQGIGGNVFNGAGGPGGYASGYGSSGYVSGFGGESFNGPGASPVFTTTAQGNDAAVNGAGGSGAAMAPNGAAQRGGNGADGKIKIEEFT